MSFSCGRRPAASTHVANQAESNEHKSITLGIIDKESLARQLYGSRSLHGLSLCNSCPFWPAHRRGLQSIVSAHTHINAYGTRVHAAESSILWATIRSAQRSVANGPKMVFRNVARQDEVVMEYSADCNHHSKIERKSEAVLSRFFSAEWQNAGGSPAVRGW